jgi:hypothetical protein
MKYLLIHIHVANAVTHKSESIVIIVNIRKYRASPQIIILSGENNFNLQFFVPPKP